MHVHIVRAWILFTQDAASPRYIFTALQKAARAVFHPDDDQLLNYLDDDGLSIEPEYYMPVIPLILVNGSDGIGTGWSSQVQQGVVAVAVIGCRCVAGV